MEKKHSFSSALFKQTAIIVTSVIFIAVIGSLAWFYASRSLHTYTHVERPSTLAIKGPNQTTVEQIDLSTVDLQDSNHQASFVFCVTGTKTESYKLELAYTTNVPFEYSVKKTTQSTESSGNDLQYTVGGKTYYYNKGGAKLSGTFINKTEDAKGKTVADLTKHAKAYDSYGTDKVQIHAEPVYYLLESQIPQDTIGDFADYYILELNWSADTATTYQKETDLVYLLAANANS